MIDEARNNSLKYIFVENTKQLAFAQNSTNANPAQEYQRCLDRFKHELYKAFEEISNHREFSCVDESDYKNYIEYDYKECNNLLQKFITKIQGLKLIYANNNNHNVMPAITRQSALDFSNASLKLKTLKIYALSNYTNRADTIDVLLNPISKM